MTNDSGLCTCAGINKGMKEAKRKIPLFKRNGCKNMGEGSRKNGVSRDSQRPTANVLLRHYVCAYFHFVIMANRLRLDVFRRWTLTVGKGIDPFSFYVPTNVALARTLSLHLFVMFV